jgi:hypothetical protein
MRFAKQRIIILYYPSVLFLLLKKLIALAQIDWPVEIGASQSIMEVVGSGYPVAL